jgi:AraC-like DNA-binding protein
MPESVHGAKNWSRFDLEVPPPGRIEYPLYAGVWDPAIPGPLSMDIHQGMEIGLVLRGQVERHYENYAFVAGPGDLHLTATWEPHGWRIRDSDTAQVVLIFLPEVLEDRMFREVPWLSFFTAPPGHRPQVTSPEMREEVLTIGRRLYYEARERPRGWAIGLRLCLFDLLLTIHRYWEPPALSSPAPAVQASSFARVMPAVQLVYGSPSRHLSSEVAAAACGLHRSRFRELFRQTMGVSFQDFCRRARLATVAQLLLTTDLPTDTIAEETGFTDGSHLHRTFVQFYGTTPGRYRAEHRATP